ncbi:hypothetical protein [Enterocloster lavalensis]|uniref:hypothetical protein n=1 Tax=Enterocloster lavalensis TaxID=460384 RepID=UPI0026654CF2|nr:hypothetical protein [Enterocloster lavalensis]
MKKVKLSTAFMYDDHSPEEPDYQLWKSIAEYMEGELAMVIESHDDKNKYVFMCLCDAIKDKELAYMMEQDSETGRYIGEREKFEDDWAAGEYSPEGHFYITPANVNIS